MFRKLLLITTLLFLSILNANAGSDGELILKKNQPSEVKDCFESLNRATFAFNQVLDGVLFKPAACMYMGKFYAESLLFAETGNGIGAIQIAGTASQAQIPFFVTACDYTLMGEEYFAASAYLSKKPELIGGVKAQDTVKLMLIGLILFILLFSSFSDIISAVFDLNTKFDIMDWIR